jgi:hypothetical protein
MISSVLGAEVVLVTAGVACDPDETTGVRFSEDIEVFFFPLLILNRRFVQFTNYLRK